MGRAVVSVKSRFVNHVFALLDRAECRQVETSAEREAAFKLRYDAYRRENWIDASESKQLFDPEYDQSSNGRVFGVFIDGVMASTIRIHVSHNENEILPSTGVFGDVILPQLRAGRGIVDSTRFATRIEYSRQYPELAYVTVRLTWLAVAHSHAHFHIATIRAEHQAFYRRVFGHDAWSGERDYPNVNCKIVCMGLDFSAHKDRVEARYPFFRSTPDERRKLFGDLGTRSEHARSPITFRSSAEGVERSVARIR
jgi:hypothetical protein